MTRILVRLMSACFTAALVVFLILLFVDVPGLGNPTCESMAPQVVQISDDNKTPFLPKIIDVVEIKTLPSTSTAIGCEGIAILSNGLKQNINFKTYEEYDKWWVKFDPVGAPFE